MSLDDARSKMEEWRRYYNEERPHSGIGQIPPILLHNSGGVSSPSSGERGRKLWSQVIQGLGAEQNRRGSNRHWLKLQWQVTRPSQLVFSKIIVRSRARPIRSSLHFLTLATPEAEAIETLGDNGSLTKVGT